MFQKFLDAQNQLYLKALDEIKAGRKETHWMWFIFPQIEGLGKTETAKFYALKNLEEAAQYFSHPVLGQHLVQISQALIKLQSCSAEEIFGHPDNLKLRSSMTLFANVPRTNPVFRDVLDKYFDGEADLRTLELLKII